MESVIRCLPLLVYSAVLSSLFKDLNKFKDLNRRVNINHRIIESLM